MALLEQKLNVKLAQKLTLTPALQQAIKLLQMTIPELQTELREEMMSNPLLEEGTLSTEEPPSNEESQKDKERDDLHESELNLEDYFRDSIEDEYIPSSHFRKDRSEDNEFSYENVASKPVSLVEHLEWQLHMNVRNPERLELALNLIRYLNEDGYFQVPVPAHETNEWLALELQVSPKQIQDAVSEIHRLDPAGVGATSLRECLLLQVEQLGFGHDEILCRMIEEYLQDIGEQRFEFVCSQLGLSENELDLYLQFIRKLEPKPGRQYSTEQPVYIVPDVYVYKVGDEYQIQLNDDGLPHLRVNRRYASLMRSAGKGTLTDEQKETASYVKERLKSAVWIIRSIQNRQRTILKVSRAIVRYQRDFLDKGIEHMKPLTLKDIADEIEMHESTVARVVKNKYMHTPRGLFELRYFFNARISSTSGHDMASIAVMEKIRKIIDTESAQKPYSDSGIVNILKAHGISIARRTVAKYRDELGIPSSSERKRLYRRTHEH